MLPESGEPVLMGRSSASCHHQLAASRMISRIHVKATYKPAPNPFDRDRVEIMCMGWNGIKIHCQGRKYDLAKGKTFTSDIKEADIIIDVHEARVLVQWPRTENDRKDCPSTDSDQTWDEGTPTQKNPRLILHDSPFIEGQRHGMGSPVSPSPVAQRAIPPSSPLFTPSRARGSVVVYEDEPSPLKRHNTVGGMTSYSARRASEILQVSQSSDISRPEDESDNDEENDPIVHSFGPFGENLLPRMASFHAGESPVRPVRSPLNLQPPPPPQDLKARHPYAQEDQKDTEVKEKTKEEEESFERVRNHTVNQLAFSRLSSTPFSTILNNLPPSYWKSNSSNTSGPSRYDIRAILENTKCIGKVAREGKDAAGQPLESEFYYIPDFDEDVGRRETVVNNLRKPGLRNCRKQHKVCHLTMDPFAFLVRYTMTNLSSAILLEEAEINRPSHGSVSPSTFHSRIRIGPLSVHICKCS
jgi:regulator of nonsense transcripts 2